MPSSEDSLGEGAVPRDADQIEQDRALKKEVWSSKANTTGGACFFGEKKKSSPGKGAQRHSINAGRVFAHKKKDEVEGSTCSTRPEKDVWRARKGHRAAEGEAEKFKLQRCAGWGEGPATKKNVDGLGVKRPMQTLRREYG